jgi:flavin-binding protein dodecin
MTQRRWTETMVEERFVEAADVMKRLPNVCVPGHFNTWPKMLYEFSDLVGQEPPPTMRLRPTAEAITRMEETLDWLKWLEPIDRKVMWLRASGERWKTVCWKVGLQRAAAHEHWLYGLCAITWHLNGHHIPTGVSRRRFIDKAVAKASA